MEATTMMNVVLGLGCCKLSWGRQRKQRMNIKTRCEGGHGGDRDHHMAGRLVDENMIVLRLRIKEMETNQNEGGRST
ncbi:hypothetical protein SESBI_04341 [Sesbania bispinosa]|nr:hypothetical protein SESBI_04341 [Sesbania bispinosa]